MKRIPRLDDPVTETFNEGGNNSFPVFVDRPPGVLPAGIVHVADAHPEWWQAQKKRGWPTRSKRATPDIGGIEGPAPKAARCAYTYLGSDTEARTRARDCVNVIRKAAKVQAPEPVIDRNAKPEPPSPAIRDERRKPAELVAVLAEHLETITPKWGLAPKPKRAKKLQGAFR